MIRISRLVHGREPVSRAIAPGAGRRTGPVVFWNLTARCNLRCVHCYLDGGPDARATGELSTDEALELLDGLAAVDAPAVLFSGGEPLLRPDLMALAAHARALGLTTALSSNGTLITEEVARELKRAGLDYVGISLDGAAERTHDLVRGVPGSFRRATGGMENCVAAGIRCGLRVTATRDNAAELPALLALAREIGIQRFCLYWLVPSGRGRDAAGTRQLDPSGIPAILDLLYEAARTIPPEEMEILTVDAPQDAVRVLERIRRDDPGRYEDARRDAASGAACSAGDRVVNIDPCGRVYPCQFAQDPAFEIGSVRSRPFPELWNDDGHPVRALFAAAGTATSGRCASCADRGLCGAGCRVRALVGCGSLAAGDPFCPGPLE